MALWVPPKVSRELQESTLAYRQELLSQAQAIQLVNHWNQILQEIDPRLMLVKAMDNATTPGLRPGYWHVIRDNEGAPPYIHVHTGPNGEYRDPDSGMLEALRRGDMWSSRSMYESRKQDERIQKAAQRERALEKEDRVNEIMDRFYSKVNTQISVPKKVQ